MGIGKSSSGPKTDKLHSINLVVTSDQLKNDLAAGLTLFDDGSDYYGFMLDFEYTHGTTAYAALSLQVRCELTAGANIMATLPSNLVSTTEDGACAMVVPSMIAGAYQRMKRGGRVFLTTSTGGNLTLGDGTVRIKGRWWGKTWG